jgi:cytidine deaminase
MNWNQLKENSYTPYSGQKNCCLVVGKDDVIYAGVRVENASFPLTMSAEQIAISSCLAAGDQPVELIYEKIPELKPVFWQIEFDIRLSIKNSFPDQALYNPTIQVPTNIRKTLADLLNVAVAPNSSFPVSALLFTGDAVIPGINVEYSEWMYGLCAERLAIGRAITAGHRTFNKLSLFVPKSVFASPCGGCRQVICEWMQDQFVELYHGNETRSSYHARDLLPYALRSIPLKKEH